MKAMTKYQLEHFKNKVRDKFAPLIDEAHLTMRKTVADMTATAEKKLALKLGITEEPFRIDSQCKYAAVARGDATIYLRLPTIKGYQEKIWDHAAGVAVIEEAGGVVTDVYGKKLDFSKGRTLSENKGVIVSNGQFHDEVLVVVRDVLGL